MAVATISLRRPSAWRAAVSLSILAVGTACTLIWNAQPKLGAIEGVCVDRKTGKPIANADVNINAYEQDAVNKVDQTNDDVTDDLGGTAAPYGWAQGSQNDDADDNSQNVGQTSGDATTDSLGRFRIDRLQQGTYSVNVNGNGYSMSSAEVTGEVHGDSTAHVTVTMDPLAPSIEFTGVTPCWLPGEDIQAPVTGTTSDSTFDVDVASVNLNTVLAHEPADLIGAQGPGQWVWQVPGTFTSVRHFTQTVATDKDDGSFYARLHIGRLPEGYYHISCKNTQVSADGWIMVTHLALIRKSWGHHVLADVVNLNTGIPLAGVGLTAYVPQKYSAQIIGRGVTGADGTARFDVGVTAPESGATLLARSGNAVAAVSMEINSPGEEGADGEGSADKADSAAYSAGALRSFVYTDRPVYRPGQAVNFKGLARWFQPRFYLPGAAKPADYFTIPSGQFVDVQIKDAMENVVSHQRLAVGDMGTWNGVVTLSDEALTGDYTIDAALGGQTAEGTFTVAAYRKPEFKLSVTFGKKRYVRGDTVVAAASAEYYFGAPVRGGKLHYFIESSESSASGAPVYGTGSAQDSTAGQFVAEGSVRLDDSGNAQVTLPTQVDKDQSQDVTYTFHFSVSDASGNSVSQDADVDVGQGEFSLNLFATPFSVNPGHVVSATATATDPDGKPVRRQSVEIVTAYQTWSGATERLTGVTTHDLTTDSNGEVVVSVTPPRDGVFLVRAKAVDKRGNAIVDDSTIWVTSGYADLETQYPDIAVMLDKDQYHIGDTAHVLINAEHPGPTALVTIEGATLYKTWTVPLNHHSTGIDIPVTDDYSPSVTISACCIYRKNYLSSNETLTIDDTRRNLNIAVMPLQSSYHPGDSAGVTIATTDSDGRPVPAEVSLGVVDSAIYAIKEDSDDGLTDMMLPSQGDVVDTSYSCPTLYLGDVDKGAVSIKLRSKFQDTAYWNPVVTTDAAGKASVTFPLPDNLTTWRVTCTGITKSSAVGRGTCEFEENKDLVARLETPSFFIAGDTSTVIAAVNNNTKTGIQARVGLTVAGVDRQGPSTQSVFVPAGGSGSVSWDVDASRIGAADLKLTAYAAGWTGTGPTPNDGVEQGVPVQTHGSRTDFWRSGSTIDHFEQKVILEHGAEPDGSVLRIRLSPSVASALIPAWEYLSQYPYGSTDDISSVLIGDAALANTLPVISNGPEESATKKQLDDEITRGLLRLARFQHDDGGWGWFDIDSADLWMTVDAVQAMLLARDAGYPVNKTVLEAGLNSIAAGTQNWRRSRHFDWAQPGDVPLAAYVEAQAGRLTDAQDNLHFLDVQWRTHPDTLRHSDLAAAIIAARKVGGPWTSVAARWMQQLWAGRLDLGDLTAWQQSPHTQSEGAEQDEPDIESTAWAMLAMQSAGLPVAGRTPSPRPLAVVPLDPRIDGVARWLMSNRSDDHWVCPQTTAMTMLALARYMQAAHERQPNFDAAVTLNGQPVHKQHFGAESLEDPDVVVDIPGTQLASMASVGLQKSGPGRLYYSMDLREAMSVGKPAPPIGVFERWYDRVWHPERLVVPFEPSGYRIKRVYLRDTSRRNFFWEDTVPTPSRDFQQGDDIIVRLIIDNIRPGSHLQIEDPIPAGCTISEVSGDDEDDWQNWWDYTDVRDDRIVYFVGDLVRGHHEIDYHLRAATAGSYDVMPTSMSGTFDPSLHVLGKADHVTISGGGQ